MSHKPLWRLLLVFFVLVLAVSAVGLFYYESQWKQIKKEKQNELLAIADLKVSQIVNWRKERLADAATIFANSLLAPHIRDLLKDPKGAKGKKQIRAWMESFRTTYQYDDILLLNGKGAVLLSVAPNREKIGPHAKGLSSRAMKARRIIFSDLYRGTAAKIRLYIVVPILDKEENETLGVFLLRIDPHVFLYPLIETWPTPSPTGETMLIRREGNGGVYLNDLRYRKDAALALRFPIRGRDLPAALAASGKEGIVEGADYRGTEVLGAIRPVPDSPWSIIAKVDKKEVSAPIRWRLWNLMLVIALCILLAGAGVVLILQRREEEEERIYREHLEETVKKRTAELEKVNRQLEASYRDMESFSYSASHDLRTPLVAINGFVRRLSKDYAEVLDSRGVELLNIVRERAGKMERLVNDLLAFSRVGAREIQSVEIDMEALASEVCEELRLSIGRRDVRIEIKPLPRAVGDPSMIRQVLVNLLGNAIKFTRPREVAWIELSGASDCDENVYNVKDNGVGFDMEQAGKLFGHFQRLDNAGEFEGTGIGLVIVKRIVEKHGGRVGAQSRAEGGATFFFTLPTLRQR
ncbi:MAG: ATP-binding protein [Nitrospirae bacterium]|nr:ATP-binding protein [Nitrospirota bacterium]